MELELLIGFTPEEHDALLAQALNEGITVAEYIHHAALAFCGMTVMVDAWKQSAEERRQRIMRSFTRGEA